MAKELARFIASTSVETLESQPHSSSIEATSNFSGHLFLESTEFTHATKSQRLGTGDFLEAYLSSSNEIAICKIKEIKNKKAYLEVISKHKLKPKNPSIKLLIGLPTLSTAEFLIEKLSELGVSEIIFFIAERTQGNRKSEIFKQKEKRWKEIALSAFKQSKQFRITKLSFQNNLKDALKTLPETLDDSKIYFSPKADPRNKNLLNLKIFSKNKALEKKEPISKTKKTSLEKDKECVDLDRDTTYLVIGPEGGLSEGEESILNSHNFTSASLGYSTLRVETAAILAAGILTLK